MLPDDAQCLVSRSGLDDRRLGLLHVSQRSCQPDLEGGVGKPWRLQEPLYGVLEGEQVGYDLVLGFLG